MVAMLNKVLSHLAPDCFAYKKDNSWETELGTFYTSQYGAMISFSAGSNPQLVASGGLDANNIPINTIKVYKDNKWQNGSSNLMGSYFRHCMVAISDKEFIVTAGYNQQQQFNEKTYFHKVNEPTRTKGPDLKVLRISPACSQISSDSSKQKKSVVVAGGLTAQTNEAITLFTTAVVEILHDGASDWVRGPDLPIPIGFAAAVQDLEGGMIVVGGTTDRKTPLDIILRLAHAGGEVTWRRMPQKLKTPRFDHVAVLVPDFLGNCYPNDATGCEEECQLCSSYQVPCKFECRCSF